MPSESVFPLDVKRTEGVFNLLTISMQTIHMNVVLFSLKKQIECHLQILPDVLMVNSCLSCLLAVSEVIKPFSCSTQLSIKFILLINLKLLTIANSFSLNIAENENSSANKYATANYYGHFHIYWQRKFPAQLSWAWKKFYNLLQFLRVRWSLITVNDCHYHRIDQLGGFFDWAKYQSQPKAIRLQAGNTIRLTFA